MEAIQPFICRGISIVGGYIFNNYTTLCLRKHSIHEDILPLLNISMFHGQGPQSATQVKFTNNHRGSSILYRQSSGRVVNEVHATAGRRAHRPSASSTSLPGRLFFAILKLFHFHVPGNTIQAQTQFQYPDVPELKPALSPASSFTSGIGRRRGAFCA